MSKPTSEQMAEFETWLAGNPKNLNTPESVDQDLEFAKIFTDEAMQRALIKADEDEKFLENYELSSDAQLVAFEEAEKIKK